MAELLQINHQQTAINLKTISDFNHYGLESCPCCIDIKLTAPPYAANGELRAPIDLVAVIDRSGSMYGTKLDLVVKVLHFVAQHLKPIDRLAIVTYDDKVVELVSLANVTQTNRIQFDANISKIRSGGQTNLSGGLIKGMNIMKKRGEKADVASVLLFTDGMANHGITNTADIVTAMQNLYAGKKDFTVNTFGFGSDHNVEMLKEISRVGNGLFYFIETTEQIPEIFTNCLGGLLSTVGQNISISIETTNGAVIKGIISTKEEAELSNRNQKGTVSLGDLQSEEERDVLVELSLPLADISTSHVYANISLNYFNVIKKDNDKLQTEAVIERSSDVSTQKPSLEVDEQRNRIKTIASLAKAAALAEKGRLEEASKVITSQQAYLSTTSSQTSPRVTCLSSDLDTAVYNLSSENIYSSRGRSTITSLGISHESQRSSCLKTPSYKTTCRDETYSRYVNVMDKPPAPVPRRSKTITLPNLPADPEIPASSTNPPPVPQRSPRLSLNLETQEDTQSAAKPDSEKGPPFISEI